MGFAEEESDMWRERNKGLFVKVTDIQTDANCTKAGNYINLRRLEGGIHWLMLWMSIPEVEPANLLFVLHLHFSHLVIPAIWIISVHSSYIGLQTPQDECPIYSFLYTHVNMHFQSFLCPHTDLGKGPFKLTERIKNN